MSQSDESAAWDVSSTKGGMVAVVASVLLLLACGGKTGDPRGVTDVTGQDGGAVGGKGGATGSGDGGRSMGSDGSGTGGRKGAASTGGSGTAGGSVGVGGDGSIISGTGGSGDGTGGTSTGVFVPPPEAVACAGVGGECRLVPTSCCSCGEADITAFVAVSAPDVGPSCSGVTCDPCATTPDPNFVAICQGGRCIAKDVRSTSLAQCADRTDCYLRHGAACCESCAPGDADVVALAKLETVGLQQAFCKPSDGCDNCMSPIPSNLSAECEAGHCVVKRN